MGFGKTSLNSSLSALDAKVWSLRPRAASQAGAIDRWHADAAGVLFHLSRADQKPIIVSILGGTGTGKSTLVNRLLGGNYSAANFRRTFTAGAVGIANGASAIPPKWLGVAHVTVSSADLPARGQSDALVVVEAPHEILGDVVLVDTPDLDGDQPTHHAQADRAFRWSEVILFLVSPEKYQMPELLPYYRLAKRYELPAIFVMNKCETPEMLEDYRKMLDDGASLFAIARDDAAYQSPAGADMAGLRNTLAGLQPAPTARREASGKLRASDLLGRLRDQVIGPMRTDRRDVDSATAALRAMETPAPGVDVNPLTEQLQRRLQQRSVLYLIGPGRVLDRVRQVPGMLVRLPRTAWDWAIRGKTALPSSPSAAPAADADSLPDFSQVLVDQFTIIQSRIDDAVRETPAGKKWVADPGWSQSASKIDPGEAGKIAKKELDELKTWLEKRWNATPRDTAILLKLLRHLPGGQKLTQWTEAAPYLLAIIVAAHHAFFGHIDLMILGGYSLATWLTERLSNEVAARTRAANRSIGRRFEKLAHEQISRSIAWIESQAPASAEIESLLAAADDLEESLG